MYSSPRSSHNDDSDIQEFLATIDRTPTEQWAKRVTAFERLVNSIPESTDDKSNKWCSDAKIMRHLAGPIGTLLRDSRSIVVRRCCESCSQLWIKCGINGRHLLKDIMPDILAVHAQTVNVIRTYVQNMVTEAMAHVPCKGAMPLWIERLKTDKSKTVREACALYLYIGLSSWMDIEGYITSEIWKQVAAGLIRSIRDPSPSTRQHVKKGLEVVRSARPDLWEEINNDPNGPASKDPKLRRFLNNIGDIDDDLSIKSRASNLSTQSQRSQKSQLSSRYNSGQRSGLGPPIRVTTTRNSGTNSPLRPSISPSTSEPGTQSSLGLLCTDKDSTTNGVKELKREASIRRSRRSLLMKDRWSQSNLQSSSSLDDQQDTEEAKVEIGHHDIAKKLLSAHKKAIDAMMEIIAIEMNAVQDFENDIDSDDPNKPSGNDVLTYFEAVGLCLSKKNKVDQELEKALEELSGAENE
mmetsp:Transcript_14679/g.21657  ORF Transcript_14679/g.21657 Transcript_14679/m.21657 type:complete len:466 (-) Transcript_14679:1464-2861(-)